MFISHDSRDHALAEAFENLLRDASGGVLKTFRSSDKKGYSGIAFGAEWYATVMERLSAATDVVALITKNSLDRPWILYEVGVARGRSGVPAFGVTFQVPLDEISGPFSQFQNSPDDEDSLTKLVLQLIRRIPDAAPREEAVRLHVGNFRMKIPKLARQARAELSPPQPNVVLFEEVKTMFRLVSDQIAELGRRWPLERRSPEEDDEAVPAWAQEADDLITELEATRRSDKRLALWKKISLIASARSASRVQGLQTIRDALRTNDRDALNVGLQELRHHLREDGRNLPRDENDVFAYDILRRLVRVAQAWTEPIPDEDTSSKSPID